MWTLSLINGLCRVKISSDVLTTNTYLVSRLLYLRFNMLAKSAGNTRITPQNYGSGNLFT